MATVSKSELKAKMLEYFRNVEETGEELIVTNNRVPVLRVLPYRPFKPVHDVFSLCRDKVTYYGDIVDDTAGEWSDV